MSRMKQGLIGLVTLVVVFTGAFTIAVGSERLANLLGDSGPASMLGSSGRLAELELRIKESDAQAEADHRLGQYTVNMIFKSPGGRKLSDARKLVLARAIVRVANEILETEVHRHAFIQALSIESEFQRFAQSPTGPKGYAQLAKQTFYESMRGCGVTQLNEEDIWETDINLYAGACYFRKMLEMPANQGDPFMAAVAYNQGPNSQAAKGYAKTGDMTDLEPLRYVAKMAFLKNTTTDAKTVNAPSISDLPKAKAGK